MSVRLFVGLPLPEGASEEATQVLDSLRASGADVRWVPRENLHVTLRFLGDVEEERVDTVIEGLDRELCEVPLFEAGFGGPGTFSSRAEMRVVWLGFREGLRDIASLASRVERKLMELGQLERIDSKPFRAHVTLGRVRGHRGLDSLTSLLEELAFPFGTHLFQEVRLFESQLSPRGATYHTRARFPLIGAGPRGSSPQGGVE